MSELRVVTQTGEALRRHLDDIARLRIQVFRAWPYLYDGNPTYERRYLQTYIDTPDAMVAICFDGERVVGASTALPLAHETEEIRRPFEHRGAEPAPTGLLQHCGSGLPPAISPPITLDNTLYLGESVLDPACRGRGIGVAFFDHREAHAAALGLTHCVFCAVQRAEDDPRRPADAVALDAFWRKRGYAPIDGCTTTLSWQEIGERVESPKPMQFWRKSPGA
ncbi:MAG TPA: GNAT family N-acetyltransferase [Pseudomonadota bacterium]|nr:GNAT family N-acetyltransferase [Pseudomonadota bacterium]